MRQLRLDAAWARLQAVRARIVDMGEGVGRIRMTSLGTAFLGFEVSAYLVDDVLIDCGFRWGRRPVLELLSGRKISAVCCTHNHEDHVGNCAAVAEEHGCPVYLRRAGRLWQEGVRQLAPYRRIWWGPVTPFEPLELPPVVATSGRELEVVPTPGHSSTHVAFFDRATGDVLTGDLFVSPGAAAVLIWGDPWQEVESLRRVAALEPRRMLTGHGLVLDRPGPALRRKADRIEEAARRSVELVGQGVAPRKAVLEVFPRGRFKDRYFELLTSREFSRLNFVKAAVKHAPKELLA